MDMTKEEKQEEKQKHQTREALYLLNRVQELSVVDAEDMRGNKEAMGVLQKAYDALGELLNSKEDFKAEVRKLGFGKQDDEE